MEILYEDNHLLAIFKPAGLLVQGDRTNRPTLFEIAKRYLKDKYNKPYGVYLGMVHRLDRGTAGVVIFAKTSKAAGRLSREFREHRVRKVYQAVVEGKITGEAFLNHMLLRDRARRGSRIIKNKASGAHQVKLFYRVIETTGDRTLMEIIPATGRHHQIRAQLSAIGHPIVGDARYGAKTRLSGGVIGLLAHQISFRHPAKKNEMTVSAPAGSVLLLKHLMRNVAC